MTAEVRDWNWDELLVDALAEGLSVVEFWSLTPRELLMYFRAAQKRAEQAHRRQAWLAWHVAALQRAKKMPPLKRIMGLDRPKVLRGEELERRKREHEEMIKRMGKPIRRPKHGS